MIKRIKFFIEVNGQQIRSLEELEEEFHLQDVLVLYRSGVLLRWLEAQGFAEKHKELAAIPDNLDTKQTAEQLIRLFCPDFSPKSIHEALWYLHFLDVQEAKLKELAANKMDRDKVISKYHAGYEQLRFAICKKALDLPYLFQAACTLSAQYWRLVELELGIFCKDMFANAPGIFFPLLALGRFRDEKSTSVHQEIKKHLLACSTKKDEQEILQAILNGKAVKGNEENVVYNAGSLKVLKKLTHESWDDIVPDTSTRIMVIYLHSGNFVRCRVERNELNSDHANIYFPVLSGLDYKGLQSGPLIYLDVTELVKKS